LCIELSSKKHWMGTTPSSITHEGRVEGERAAKSRPVEWLGRAGLIAQGTVYGLVGVLALALALGQGGKATSPQGALKTVAGFGWGKFVIALLALGFAGYAVWRFADALFDRGGEGDDAKGIGKRAVEFGTACIYSAFAVSAVSILFGGGGGSGGGHKQAAGILGWPGGRWIVGAIGVGFAIAALVHVHEAFTSKFMDEMDTSEMGPDERDVIERIGQVGWTARAVAFGLVGVFLVKSAVEYDPSDAVGLGGALAKLAHASYGPLLLGLTAAGLVAFAVFCFAQARYRRV
jgi:hypothetical protein